MRPEHFQDKGSFFTIGLIREPCQYMLSEYMWGATGRDPRQPRDPAHTHPMGHLALDLHAQGHGALYAPPHSKEHFATWLFSRYVTAADIHQRGHEQMVALTGRTVRIHGLQKTFTELNGKEGRVRSYNSAKGKYEVVDIEGATPQALLKPENLEATGA